MKKVLFFLSVAMAFMACNPEVSGPAASFENAFPVMENEVGVFKIVVSNYESGEPLTIPVTFGGSAEKGVDYEVSAEAFVWGGAEPVTEIVLTPKVFAADKNVVLTLELPEGFSAGKYPVATFTFVDKLGYVSFESNSTLAIGSKDITVNVMDGYGAGLILENGAEIALEVDTQASTAVEGTHFQFVNGKKAIVPAGQKKGIVTIDLLSYAADCNKLVLKIADDRFYHGDYPEIEITLESYWAKLNGKWVMNEIVTTADVLDGSWYGSCTYVGLPEFNAADAITFDVAEGKAVPEFSSTYKNYFLGESNIAKGNTIYMRTGMGGAGVDLQLVEFDNINRYFHATEMSEDKKALVGISFTTDEETGAELLDMYIVDHTSKSFMPELNDFSMYGTEKPVATMTGCYLNATFKKAN